ncbi:MAG TPA: NmrA family NAD(P)-binding protein [Longimicrobiales bacterium]|nr:NmrA family NAD(P)-binding protein [Longimicrobiales bacterium]
MATLNVLVVGATGLQGGAAAHALVQAGHSVRAMTRNLAHPAAEALRLRGARLAWTDLDDERRVSEAVAGMDAVVAVAAEVCQGQRLVTVAQRAGVGHFVYLSLPGAQTVTHAPLLDSRHEIERYLQASHLPFTIVSPGFLMENLLAPPWLDGLRRGELLLPMPAGRKLPQVAAADLGRFVRVVVEQRQRFLGRRVDIASDALTPIEMAASLARITGRPLRHVEPADEQFAPASPVAAAVCAWLGEHDTTADVGWLRSEFSEVNWHTLDGWAKRQDWAPLDPAPA